MFRFVNYWNIYQFANLLNGPTSAGPRNHRRRWGRTSTGHPVRSAAGHVPSVAELVDAQRRIQRRHRPKQRRLPTANATLLVHQRLPTIHTGVDADSAAVSAKFQCKFLGVCVHVLCAAREKQQFHLTVMPLPPK